MKLAGILGFTKLGASKSSGSNHDIAVGLTSTTLLYYFEIKIINLHGNYCDFVLALSSQNTELCCPLPENVD